MQRFGSSISVRLISLSQILFTLAGASRRWELATLSYLTATHVIRWAQIPRSTACMTSAPDCTQSPSQPMQNTTRTHTAYKKKPSKHTRDEFTQGSTRTGHTNTRAAHEQHTWECKSTSSMSSKKVGTKCLPSLAAAWDALFFVMPFLVTIGSGVKGPGGLVFLFSISASQCVSHSG